MTTNEYHLVIHTPGYNKDVLDTKGIDLIVLGLAVRNGLEPEQFKFSVLKYPGHVLCFVIISYPCAEVLDRIKDPIVNTLKRASTIPTTSARLLNSEQYKFFQACLENETISNQIIANITPFIIVDIQKVRKDMNKNSSNENCNEHYLVIQTPGCNKDTLNAKGADLVVLGLAARNGLKPDQFKFSVLEYPARPLTFIVISCPCVEALNKIENSIVNTLRQASAIPVAGARLLNSEQYRLFQSCLKDETVCYQIVIDNTPFIIVDVERVRESMDKDSSKG